MKCKSFIFILLSYILLSLPVNAFDKALNDFKNDVDDAIKEFEKGLKKLNNSNSEIAQSLDLASDEFEDLLKFTEETLNNENIHASIDAIEFLTSNIDAAIKTIPPETITNMQEIDFSTFEDNEMNMLSEIMTDMNRKKMDDFKEMVTSMVVLEKQGFEAEVFMEEMQNLDMGLAMLNDDTMEIDFELAGLSEKSLDEVGKELDTFDKNLQNLKAQQLIAKVAGVSEGVAKTSPSVDNKVSDVKVSSVSTGMNAPMETPSLGESTKEVTGSVKEAEVGEVQVEITVEVGTVEESTVTTATDNVSKVVETKQIAQTTEEVVSAVESSNVSEKVTETTEQIEEVMEDTQIAEQISSAQQRMLDFGIFDSSGGITSNMNKIDVLIEAGGLLSYDEIKTLEDSIQERIVDLANSAGRFDILAPEAQAQLMCEQGNVQAGNQVKLSGTEGNTGNPNQKGVWDCNKL